MPGRGFACREGRHDLEAGERPLELDDGFAGLVSGVERTIASDVRATIGPPAQQPISRIRYFGSGLETTGRRQLTSWRQLAR